MNMKSVRLLAVPILLLLRPEVSLGNISLLVEEAVGGAGEFTGSGHAAVYLSNLCAESPTQLRHCKPGEEGAVVSTYPEFGAQKSYKWMAIPLTAFLYAVTTREEKPLYANGKIRRYLRDQYRLQHLTSLVPSLPDSSMPPGRWAEMLGGGINRDIYALTVRTTSAQDAKLLADFQKMTNVNNFSTMYNNCADFARDTVNLVFPGSSHRDVLNDFTMTTPKAIARSFTRYATARPELNFHIVKYSQIDGAIRRSLNNRNFTEKSIVSKKYFLTMAFTMPELLPIMGITYLTTGWYNVDPQYKKYAGEEIARINLEAKQLKVRRMMTSFVEDPNVALITPQDLEKRRAVHREDMFGTEQLWMRYRERFRPMLAKAIAEKYFLDAKELQTFFKDLEIQSVPELDAHGQLVLKVDDRGVHETLGLTRQNLESPENSSRLAYKLMLAKVNVVLTAPSRNRPSRREFEEDWHLLQSIASRATPYSSAAGDGKPVPRFRQTEEVVPFSKRSQKLLMTITH